MSAYQWQLEVGLANSAASCHDLDCSGCLIPYTRGSPDPRFLSVEVA